MFKKELYFERYLGAMAKQAGTKKWKSLRIEKIADLYLKHLSTDGIEGTDILLNNFLDSEEIYYTPETLVAVIALLKERKLVEEDEHNRAALGYYRPKEDAGEEILHPAAWLGSIEGMINGCLITGRGIDFVSKGQEIDVQGVAERKAFWDKILERIITFGIALVTAIAVAFCTEPVKQWWAKKDKQEKAKSSNESSPVRPGIDPRQRPEPGKPAGAAAPRSRARR